MKLNTSESVFGLETSAIEKLRGIAFLTCYLEEDKEDGWSTSSAAQNRFTTR